MKHPVYADKIKVNWPNNYEAQAVYDYFLKSPP